MPEQTTPEGSGNVDPGEGFDARQAAGAAAVAGVIGAAVGALRALSAHRSRDDADGPDPTANGNHGGSAGEELEATDDDAEPISKGDDTDADSGEADDGETGDGSSDDEANESEPSHDRAAERDTTTGKRDAKEEPGDASAGDASAGDESETAERPGAARGQVREIVRRAREEFTELHGAPPESLSSLEQTERGWVASLEVVEVRRVPDSTDVLATYRVELDGDGNLVRYERVGRYYRSQADAGGGG